MKRKKRNEKIKEQLKGEETMEIEEQTRREETKERDE